MKVYIQVVAFDEELGMKSSREEELDVPGAVLKLHEMFAKGQDQDNVAKQMLNVMRDTVFMGAAKELQASRRNPGAALNEQVTAGGKVGGSGGGGTNAIGEMLGLDLIQNANKKAATQQPTHQPPPQRPAPPQMGPGAVGFGPHRNR